MKIQGILLDHHYGHLADPILKVWERENVLEDMVRENVQIIRLEERLPRDTDDHTLWLYCQTHAFVLITDNRSGKGPHSLHETIMELLEPRSLPVLTPGRLNRLTIDDSYRTAVFLDLADILIDIIWTERYLGVGRLFLPLPMKSQ